MSPRPIFGSFTKLVLQSWCACEAHSIQRGESVTPPTVVSIVKSWLTENLGNIGSDQSSHVFHDDINVSFSAVSVEFYNNAQLNAEGKNASLEDIKELFVDT